MYGIHRPSRWQENPYATLSADPLTASAISAAAWLAH